MADFSIHYTDSCKSQIKHQFKFLTLKMGNQPASNYVQQTLAGFEERVANHPNSTPLCSELVNLGLTRFRDYVDSNKQFRLLYTVDENNQCINVVAFLNTRQSIREALIDFCLMFE